MNAMRRRGCLALVVVGLGASAAWGSPLNAEFTLDLTPEWQSAIVEARLTVVDSWTDYGLGDLFPDPPTVLVEPLISAGTDELVMEFLGAEPEGDDEVYGLSYNYAEDPDLSKKKVLLKKAEIEKGKEIWIVLEDISGLKKKARLKADESGNKMDVEFPVWATKKEHLAVLNGTCEELLKDVGFDSTKVKEGKGGIYTAAKKTKKAASNTKKLGELSVVPEPATLALLVLGGLSVLARRSRT
ncbi:MAG TPA: PEP-CTERM sorting domain-containing protein [Phycisphaerae bacterium]|nr:PEP-CTERM sorting domain-containing protein [Phycisphaerae bacterium]